MGAGRRAEREASTSSSESESSDGGIDDDSLLERMAAAARRGARRMTRGVLQGTVRHDESSGTAGYRWRRSNSNGIWQ